MYRSWIGCGVVFACLAALPAVLPAQERGDAPAPSGDGQADQGPAAADLDSEASDRRAEPQPGGRDPGPVSATHPAEGASEADREVTTGEAFIRKLRQGGWTMVFLLAVSVFGVAYTIERAVRLRRGAIVPRGLADRADELWRTGRREAVANLENENSSTLARVLSVVARHGDRPMPEVSMLAGDVASRDLKRHLQRAYPLAVVATISPLLGLLGTVIGMIGAFDKVAAAGSLGDASLLGGDISKALITTGVGLAIAVPSLALYHFFKSRTALYGIILEEEVGELLTEWFALSGDREAGRES